MYTTFFGLNEKPFAITPNPRYLFMSERHSEALAHLIYGIKESGGFIQLTGEVGTGKTTLIRGLLQRLPNNADVALILNPQLSATEFLEAILSELGIEAPADTNSLKAMTDVLNVYLLDNYSKGRRTILMVDEAQNFSVDVLEQIRLLTNLETSKHKLLQITLIGQPELRTMLARNDLRQLAQRITARYHLEPLSQDESELYILHRLKVAGATRDIFNQAACRELYRLSGGIPRIINVIADRALLGGFTTEQHVIDKNLIDRAAAEVYGADPDQKGKLQSKLGLAAAAGIAALLIGAAIFTAMRYMDNGRVAPAVAQSNVATAPVNTVPTYSAPAVAAPSQIPVKAAPSVATVASIQPAGAAAPAQAANNIATPPPILAELLRKHTDATDTHSAFGNLFALWGIELGPRSSRACEQARQFELTCLFQRGSLSNLTRLDRPAILTLQDAQGISHQVVLAGLQNEVAYIDVAGQRHPVAVDELNQYWFGEYLLLWRPQLNTVKSFLPGMKDPDIVWLRQSLEAIQGSPISPLESEDYYDSQLEERVRQYQAQRRLVVDGMVGQQTQIVINSDLNIGAPRLVRNN